MLALLALTLPVVFEPVDRDGDGLSDFLERHKYRTNPELADSDGDGVPDDDWNERREFTYSVRSVIQILPPVTLDVLSDDYQDARVLNRTESYIELEVVHYPLNSVAEKIASDPYWRPRVAGMSKWTAPGPSSNWDPAMRDELVAALQADGIDTEQLADRELVMRATRWLLDRSTPTHRKTTFRSEWTGQEMRIHPELEQAFRSDSDAMPIAERWQRELFAKGMFLNRERGTCTSTAIYLNGCLRALGVPTRILLGVPIIDASDKREVELARSEIRQAEVRRAILSAAEDHGQSWASHTFNEVYVDGRWRRLNYATLGQNILDANCMGLLTHVATFSDWSEGNLASTWGLRQARRSGSDDVFGGANPYSTISLSDQFGVHSGLTPDSVRPKSPCEPALAELSVLSAEWSDDPQATAPRRHLDPPRILLRVGDKADFPCHKQFTSLCDPQFELRAAGHPTLTARHGIGGSSSSAGSFIWLRLDSQSWSQLAPEANYSLHPLNQEPGFAWRVPGGLTLRRPE